jgi:hypothetical protein
MLYEGELTEHGVDPSKYHLAYEHPLAITMPAAVKNFHVLSNLHMHLFINRSPEHFITSDNPVVLYNQFCEGVRSQGVLGWACAGIQVMLPLSPTHLLILYDPTIYRIPAKDGAGHSTLTKLADVKSLNALQILNANRSIYFCDETQSDILLWQVGQLARKRSRKRNVLVQSERVGPGDRPGELVYQYELMLPHSLAVSAIRLTGVAKAVPVEQRAGIYRWTDSSRRDHSDQRRASGRYLAHRRFID